ncbi:MAG: stage 0 sporulation family protein [Clostridia bacterium]
MTEIIGVRFKKSGKTYYFDPEGIKVLKEESVIVETARGLEFGEVTIANSNVADEMVVQPLKKVIRKATDEDIKKDSQNRDKEVKAFDICLTKIKKYNLEMQLTEVEYTFDNNKVLFYFTAENRVDFRDLVKDLASIFHTRIELRQIGVRDEAKMLGGLGICGRPFCCSSFLGEFQPVSIKMAKEQGLSLNPVKISGTCGRLMCCLKYEQFAYDDLLKNTPKVDAVVDTDEGRGVVIEVNLLSGMLKVRLNNDEMVPKMFNKKDVKLIRDGKIKLSKKEMAELKKLEDK